MKTILTDIDGVCLYWEEHFHEWMRYRGHEQKHHGLYDIDRMYSVSEEEGERLSKEFCNSSWIAFCPPYKDAKSGIATLVEKGYNFIGITSLSKDPYTKELRWKNLIDQFGTDAFVDLYCLDPDISKKHTLEQWRNSGMWWLEDLPTNCDLGIDLGLKGILMEHSYNKEYSGKAIKAKNWQDICKIIIG